MAEREPLPIPDDPLEWAPMRAYDGRRSFEIRDPLVEPLWSGTRVLAHVRVDPDAEPAATVRLIEELGADVAPELPELTRTLGEGVLALEAIIDGVITRQLTLDGVGAAAIPEVQSRPTEMFIRSNLDFDVQPRGVIEERANEADPVDGFGGISTSHISRSSRDFPARATFASSR